MGGHTIEWLLTTSVNKPAVLRILPLPNVALVHWSLNCLDERAVKPSLFLVLLVLKHSKVV